MKGAGSSQDEWIAGLAARLAARGWAAPASVALSFLQPWGVLGSQALILMEPFLGRWAGDAHRLAVLLEQREGVQALAEGLQREQRRMSALYERES